MYYISVYMLLLSCPTSVVSGTGKLYPGDGGAGSAVAVDSMIKD